MVVVPSLLSMLFQCEIILQLFTYFPAVETSSYQLAGPGLACIDDRLMFLACSSTFKIDISAFATLISINYVSLFKLTIKEHLEID